MSVSKIHVLKVLNSHILALLGVLCLLSSCSLFTTKISDFLYEQENKIYVSSIEFDTTYPTDSDGITCIPSNEDIPLRFLIQNPGAFPLTASIETQADSSSVLSDFSSSERYTYNSDPGTTDVVELVYTKEMLTALEKNKAGTDISPTLYLYASDDYTYEDSIDPYVATLNVNSPPPPVQGACVMVDEAFKTNSSKGKYVLCFNLPDDLFSKDNDDYGIHSDVITGKIEGLTGIIDAGDNTSVSYKKFEQGFSLELDPESGTYNTVYLPSKEPIKLGVNSYTNVQSSTTADGMPAATFGAWTYPVYITDGAYSYSGDVREYTITLIDEAGLESSVTVATNSHQLKPVTANADSTEVITLADDEYYTLILTAPTRTVGTIFEEVSDVTIVYKIYSKDYSTGSAVTTLIKKGEELDTVSCQLYEGTYVVQAYAHKEGYIDSEILNVTLYLGAKIEVEMNIETPGEYNAYVGVAPVEFWTEDIKQSVKTRSIYVETYLYSTYEDEDSGETRKIIETSKKYDVEMYLMQNGEVIYDSVIEDFYENKVYYLTGDQENKWSFETSCLLWQTLHDEVYTLLIKVIPSETEIFSGSIPITVHYGSEDEGG